MDLKRFPSNINGVEDKDLKISFGKHLWKLNTLQNIHHSR